ncbi:MAG: hypothetical protein GX868_02640 [Actinobacteria bacterium]|nr:hypothetical protein [Actinomycetota bacterium]
MIDLFDGLVMALSGGASLGGALIDACGAATAHPATRSLGAELRRGTPLDRALDRWCTEFAIDEARTAAAVFHALLDGGADAIGTTERLAAVLRERVELDDEVRSARAPALASAATLSALPVLGVGVIAAIESDTARWLFGTPAGGALVAGAVGWNVLGWFWMRQSVAMVSP